MTNDELKSTLTQLLPEATFEEGGQWVAVVIDSTKWLDFAQALRTNENLFFDDLFCLTCVDWKTHLSMVYHLSSRKHRHTVVIKSKLDRVNPEIESVAHIWRTAEFHEREVYDLFGVIFLHHPDLRRLLLTDDWVGWPLRKDYEDAVNMIKL